MPARAGLPAEQHEVWMRENLAKYRESLLLWDEGVARGTLPFRALLDAKDQAVMVHLNALDAGIEDMAEKAAAAVDSIDMILMRFLSSSRVGGSSCQRWWSKVCPSCRELSGGEMFYARMTEDR